VIPALEVSPVLPGEFAWLSELTVAAYRAVAPMPDGYAAELADVRGRAAYPGAVVLAARIDGRVVGGATVVLDPGSPLAEVLEPGTAGLRMLAVDPAAQGAGVGRALVEATLELARRRGLCRLSLHTHASSSGPGRSTSRWASSAPPSATCGSPAACIC
jgi:GNAT superfamily N-acetyltransferase